MEEDQKDLQFLSFFDILRESLKIIYQQRIIFLQLALILILPFSLIYMTRPKTSHLLLDHFTVSGGIYGYLYFVSFTASLSEWVEYTVVIQAAYVLSTSVLTYTVGCIYSSKEVTLVAILAVAPRVWKRVIVTFLGFFALVILYNLFFTFMIFLHIYIITVIWSVFNSGLFYVDAILCVLCLVGLSYLYVIWQLSNVVSVLEESYGFKALRKGSKLIEGRMVISLSLFLVVNLLMIGTQKLYINLNVGVFAKVGFGVIGLVVLCGLILLGQVAQTLLYLVCKSYHNEWIDKNALAHHLEVCHSEGCFRGMQEVYNSYVNVV